MRALEQNGFTAVHVARGASYAVIQNITTYGAMAVSFAILARVVTPEEIGVLAVLTLVNGLCQAVAALSLSKTAAKFIAESVGEKDLAGSIFYQVIRITLILGATLGLGVFLAADILSTQMLGHSAYKILFQVQAFDIVIFTGLLPVLAGAMLGFQKFKESALLGLASTFVRQSLIIILVVLLEGLLGLVVAWVISDLASASIYLAYLSRYVGRPKFDFPLNKLLNFTWPISISSMVDFAYIWFDRAMLLAFVPLTALGVYNATMMGFSALASISTAIAAILLPGYSTIQGLHERESLSDAVRLASRYLSFIVIPLAFGLMATSKPALTLFVGPAYVEGSDPLKILSVALAFTAIIAAVNPMLLALGETRALSVTTIVSVCLSVVAAFEFLPFWGILGASVARAFGMAISTGLAIMFLRRRLTIRLDIQAILKNLLAGSIMAATVAVIQVWFYSEYLLPLYILAGLATHLIMLRLVKAVGEEDIDLLRRYFGPRLGFAVTFLRCILSPVQPRAWD